MTARESILLPGGFGYIGSHTMVCLLESTPHTIVVLDDFSNCKRDVVEGVLRTVRADTGQEIEALARRVVAYEGSILDAQLLEKVFRDSREAGRPITAVVNFAGKKSTNESIYEPLAYYETNVVGALRILQAMEQFAECTRFIFSSTAAIYGDRDRCDESMPCAPCTPYGETKWCIEMMLRAAARRNRGWKVLCLRYFNPVGNHPLALIGDEPTSSLPTNLFPVIGKALLRLLPALSIFGGDYPTHDGTPVRDFIHVMDLGTASHAAEAHLAALDYCARMPASSETINIGTGQGHSVLEVVQEFHRLGAAFPYKIVGRREGDLAQLVAAIGRAENILKWKASRGLKEMCQSYITYVNNLANQPPVEPSPVSVGAAQPSPPCVTVQ